MVVRDDDDSEKLEELGEEMLEESKKERQVSEKGVEAQQQAVNLMRKYQLSGIASSVWKIFRPLIVIAIIILLILAFLFFTQSSLEPSRKILRTLSQPALWVKEIGKIGANLGLWARGTKESVTKFWEKQKEIALSDYFVGEVEENQETPLGVYISDLRRASDEFMLGEPIQVYALLSARTLSDQTINITNSCFIEWDYGDRTKAQKIFPEKLFNIYQYAEETINCEFESQKAGSFPVHLVSEFNFKTSAYLPIYLINRQRAQALRSQNIDIYQEYKIPMNEVAKYTEGPIMIGIEVTPELVEVVSSTDTNKGGLTPGAHPQLGITFDNRWDGKIKKIRGIEIRTPSQIKLDKANCFFEISKAEEDKGVENIYYVSAETIRSIKDFKSFRCQLNVNEKVLENTPVTVRYIKVNADYDYEIDESFIVTVSDIQYPRPSPGGAVSDIVRTKDLMSNYCAYYDAINRASSETNVDTCLLIAAITQESSGDQFAISDVGAAGLVQIMPGTAKKFGLKVFENADYTGSNGEGQQEYVQRLKKFVSENKKNNPGIIFTQDERFDIYKNILCAAKYYKENLGRFKGDIKEAIAAYYTGETNVGLRCCPTCISSKSCDFSSCHPYDYCSEKLNSIIVSPSVPVYVSQVYAKYETCLNQINTWDCKPPERITGLNAKQYSDEFTVLYWDMPQSSNLARYKIYRKEDKIGSEYSSKELLSVEKNRDYAVIHTTLPGNYEYKIVAVNSQGVESEPAFVKVSVPTTKIDYPIQGFSISLSANDQITASWNRHNFDFTGKIYANGNLIPYYLIVSYAPEDGVCKNYKDTTNSIKQRANPYKTDFTEYRVSFAAPLPGNYCYRVAAHINMDDGFTGLNYWSEPKYLTVPVKEKEIPK